MSSDVTINILAKDETAAAFKQVEGALSKLENEVDNYSKSNKDASSSVLELNASMEVFSRIGTAVYSFVKDAIKVTFDYSQEISKLSAITGSGAEETSRLVQVMQDFGVTGQQVETIIRKMSSQGLSPTLATMQELSGQFLQLKDGSEKAAFAQKYFGAAGAEVSAILSQGSDNLARMNDEVNRNLVLTDEQVRKNEEARLALDALGDSWDGFKVRFGSALGEAILNQQRYNEAVEHLPPYMRTNTQAVLEMADSLDRLNTIEETSISRNEDYIASVDEVTAAEDNRTFSNETLLSTMMNLQRETEAFESKNASLTTRMQELTAAQAEFAVGSEKYNDIQKEIDETSKSIEKLAAEHEMAGRRIAYSLLQQKMAVDGLSDAEFQALLGIGVSWGILDAKTAQATRDMVDNLQPVIQETATAAVMTGRLVGQITQLAINAGKTFDFYAVMHAIGDWQSINRVNGAAVQNCFVGNTPILLAEGGAVNIEDISIGDAVVSMNVETGELSSGIVAEKMVHTSSMYLLINGVGVTPEHPLYCNGKWMLAGEVSIGDALMGLTGNVTVETIEYVYGEAKTYNLHIDNQHHNYFAGGILAHNKATGGLVRGSGTGFTDTFMAPLANNEFVVRSSVVRQPGMLDHLESLNSGGDGGAGVGRSANVTVNVSSFISLADQRDAADKLTPIIQQAIRNAQGVI